MEVITQNYKSMWVSTPYLQMVINRFKTVLPYALSLFAGGIYPFAFSPYGYVGLVYISLALLVFNLAKCSNLKGAAVVGWLFGVGVFTTGMYWFYYALSIFGEANPVISSLLSAVFILFLALFFALFGVVAFKLKKVTTLYQWYWLIPLLWAGFEWFRSWFLTGIPWLLSGVTQVDNWLSGALPIIGVFGTGALVMFISVVFIQLIQLSKIRYKIVLMGIVIIIALLASTFKNRLWVQPYNHSVSVALVQGNIKQSLKFQKGLLLKILQTYTSLTQQYLDKDLVIWPETAIPAVYDDVDDWLQPYVEIYKKERVQVLTGLFTYSDKAQKSYFNSLLDLTNDNNVYSKSHLVPFGEYIPFRSFFKFVADYIQIPMSDLQTAPEGQAYMNIAAYKAGVSICYEDAYSHLFINKGNVPDFYINISNDAWFADSSAPWQHLEMARSRSAEYQKPMLRSTNNGVSGIIGYFGEVERQSKQFQQEVLTGEIVPTKGLTPFAKYQNLPLVILALFAFIFVFYRNKFT